MGRVIRSNPQPLSPLN